MFHQEEVVIVGGGAGGAELAVALGRRFGGSRMNVTLVDCATSHLWKPRLHEIAAGVLGAGEDETSFLALGRANRFRFVLGALQGLDTQSKTISISAVADANGANLLGPRQIRYDTLVLAFGSQVNDFGVDGVIEHCHMLDSGEQAVNFQRRFLEMAIRASNGSLDRVRVGIVGAGATGVELAAELHHAASAVRQFGGLIEAGQLEVTVVDMASRVLPNSSERTSAFAERVLQRLGVTICLNAGVEKITREALILKSGQPIPCELKVWASGVIGRPLAATLAGLTTDKARRIVCDDRLRCDPKREIYAFGDCARVVEPSSQRPLPATAQVAHQQAAYLARVLGSSTRDNAPPFNYRPRGSLVSLGAGPATGDIQLPAAGSFAVRGMGPKFLYASLLLMHQGALVGRLRAVAIAAADRLRRSLVPHVKLH